jgi:hypothetical protein
VRKWGLVNKLSTDPTNSTVRKRIRWKVDEHVSDGFDRLACERIKDGFDRLKGRKIEFGRV